MGVLDVHGWHTECGECGYGSGGPMSDPTRRPHGPLSPSSRECPECGVKFTHVRNSYSYNPREHELVTKLDV